MFSAAARYGAPISPTGIAVRAGRAKPEQAELVCKSDCNFPSHAALVAVLAARKARSGLSGRASMKLAHHFSALSPRQSENGQMDAGPSRWTALVNLGMIATRR
jgi:hypothetical protein